MSLNLKLWHFWFCIHGFGFILPLLSRQQKHISPAEWLLIPWQPVVAELSHKLWSKCTDMSGRSLWRGWDLNPRVFFTHIWCFKASDSRSASLFSDHVTWRDKLQADCWCIDTTALIWFSAEEGLYIFSDLGPPRWSWKNVADIYFVPCNHY